MPSPSATYMFNYCIIFFSESTLVKILYVSPLIYINDMSSPSVPINC